MAPLETLPCGLHAVLPTPFTSTEECDLGGVARLVEFYLKAGASGIVALTTLGEVDRLCEAERRSLIEAIIAAAGERVPVTVGVDHPGTIVAAKRAELAITLGATAVLASPPRGTTADRYLRDHFLTIAESASVPLVIQDYPQANGVQLPVEFLAEIIGALPHGAAVKLEDPPTALKTKRLLALEPTAQVFGGLGGSSLQDELAAGAIGSMTGFAMPELLVAVIEASQRASQHRTHAAQKKAAPFIALETRPGVGIAIRKELLRRRGAITTAVVRRPGLPLTAAPIEEIDSTLSRLAHEITVRG